MVSFRGQKKLLGFYSKFPTTIPIPFICGVPPPPPDLFHTFLTLNGRAGGYEIDPPGWTSTQGLKITENGRYCLYKFAVKYKIKCPQVVLSGYKLYKEDLLNHSNNPFASRWYLPQVGII